MYKIIQRKKRRNRNKESTIDAFPKINTKRTYDARNRHKNYEEEEDEEIGLALDPDKEQEVADVEFEDDEDHPEYNHIAPDHLEEQQNEMQKKKEMHKTIMIDCGI